MPSALRSRMHSITSVPASSDDQPGLVTTRDEDPGRVPEQLESRLGVGVLSRLHPQPVRLRRPQLPEDFDVALSSLRCLLGGGGDDGDASLLAPCQRDEALQDVAAGTLVLGTPDRHHRTLADLSRRRRRHGG